MDHKPLSKTTPSVAEPVPVSAGRLTASGISIVELALILPVIILLIVGLVDYGSSLREIQVISQAARDGARAGSAHPRVFPGIACAATDTPLSTIDCTIQSQILGSDPVVNAAKKATCNSLLTSKASGSWDISAEVSCLTEDSSKFQLLKVKIQQSASGSSCLLCWQDWIAALKPQTESAFVLERECTPGC